ncbi:MAG: Gfo/Idh/MocA family oxidoreductase, partial [Candidatus Margulisbacteria bacterium]|nr:Gfo/Idh/MocA family oxidoreductase [Candidatus Margulisiibacteriota bacterium]
MSKLKVGIIGLGVGEKHIEGYAKHPQCEVIALCDIDDKKISMAKKKYPKLSITKNADDILTNPQINIISIASYDNFHHEQIVKAIENKKHIFVEKPLCLYEKEAINIRKLLKKHPHIKMSSNLILRKSPRFLWLKEQISKKNFGDIYYLEGDYNYGRLHKITEGWRGKLDFYSVIYGGGEHIVDLLLWLTEDDVEEVMSYGNKIASQNTNFKYNDMVVSILKFKSGKVAKISNNFGCVMPHFHGLAVYGTEASFINGLEHGLLFKSREKNAEKIELAYPGVHKGDLIYSFVEAIIANTTAEVTAEDVFKSMSVCFAMEKA